MVVGAPSGKLNMFVYKVGDHQLPEICIPSVLENYSLTCIKTSTPLCKMKFNTKQHQEITTEHNTLAIPLTPPPQTDMCLQELKKDFANTNPFFPVCSLRTHYSLSSFF